MAMDDGQALEVQIRALQEENRRLRQRLAAIEDREQAGKEARARLMRGGWRLLVPLVDRQRVVRSFGQLAETAGEFSGPRDRWPGRDKVLADARDFMESLVRFMVRRRLVILFFSLLAGAIPLMQIWLIVQQNRIIESQNEFFEIQVYEVVARSMTEGDRNARLMTGALLANADPGFLAGVVHETFDPELLGIYRTEGVNAAVRRLEDAAFRGHLVRAVARSVTDRGVGSEPADPHSLLAASRPMFQRILQDAADRMPEVLRLGRQDGEIDGALAEQVDNYLAQVGALLRVYGRLARSAGELDAFHEDIRPLLGRLAGRRTTGDSRFASTYRAVMQDVLFEVAVGPALDDAPVNLQREGLAPEEALQTGLRKLRAGVGRDAAQWELFEEQVTR
ncbi:MAG: hypothetical protein ACOCV4_05765 [Myxococcota bacterium]